MKMRISSKTQKMLFTPFFLSQKVNVKQLMTEETDNFLLWEFLYCPIQSIHMQIKCSYNELGCSDSMNNTSAVMLFSIHRKHRNKPCVKKSSGAASESVDAQSFGQRHCFPRRSVSPL